MRKSAPSTPRPINADFVPPGLATLASSPPVGDHWGHEIKFDGYRVQACIDGRTVRLFTRNGLDWTHRFGDLSKALLRLQLSSAVIDGEVLVENDRGALISRNWWLI